MPDYENLYEQGVVGYLNEENRVFEPRQIGVYTVTYRIEDGEWASEEDEARYHGIYAQITVEIVESTGAAQQ